MTHPSESSRWRLRAEETRVIAEEMKHPASIRMLEVMAQEYERIANRIEKTWGKQ